MIHGSLIVALSTPVLITVAVAAFFALLAVLAFARVVLRGEPRARRLRVGVFVERDADEPPRTG